MDCLFFQGKLCPNDTVPDVRPPTLTKQNKRTSVLHKQKVLLWGRREPTNPNSAPVLVPAEVGEEEEMFIHPHV